MSVLQTRYEVKFEKRGKRQVQGGSGNGTKAREKRSEHDALATFLKQVHVVEAIRLHRASACMCSSSISSSSSSSSSTSRVASPVTVNRALGDSRISDSSGKKLKLRREDKRALNPPPPPSPRLASAVARRARESEPIVLFCFIWSGACASALSQHNITINIPDFEHLCTGAHSSL